MLHDDPGLHETSNLKENSMKKAKKKLELAKETVRSLEQSDLKHVAGGSERYCVWQPDEAPSAPCH